MTLPLGKVQEVPKGWGKEVIICNDNYHGYCGKLLVLKPNAKTSMHFHLNKHETWGCIEGEVLINWIDPTNADSMPPVLLKYGDVLVVKPGMIHQLVGGEHGGTIMEVSTIDRETDSYRVGKGDSQKETKNEN